MSTALPLAISSNEAVPSTRFRLGYRPWLDGLRGFAILAVMAYHFEPRWFPHGHVGVDLFFVISGFLITILLLEEWHVSEAISFQGFYTRRALRLFPALWTMLLASLALMMFTHVEKNFLAPLYAFFYSTNWIVAWNIDVVPSPVVITWSLAIEEQFYIVWPLVLFTLLRLRVSKPAILCFLGIGIVLVCANRTFLNSSGISVLRVAHGSDTRTDGLMIGCFAAVWLSEKTPPLLLLKVLKVSTTILGFLFLLYLSGIIAPYGFGLTLANLFFASAVVVLLSSQSSQLKKALESKWPVLIGKLSYSLYLWHLFAFFAVSQLRVPQVVAFMASFTLAFILAGVSYYMIERPFLKMKSQSQAHVLNASTAVSAARSRNLYQTP